MKRVHNNHASQVIADFVKLMMFHDFSVLTIINDKLDSSSLYSPMLLCSEDDNGAHKPRMLEHSLVFYNLYIECTDHQYIQCIFCILF